MLRHVVLFHWKPGTTPEQVRAVTDGLRALPAVIPEIAGYHVGPDAGLVEGNADFAVVADFASEADWATYRAHPVHQAVIAEHITPIAAERLSAQYELIL